MYDRLLKKRPDNADLLYGRAFLAMNQGQTEVAEDLFSRCLEVHEQNPRCLRGEALFQLQKGDLVAARRFIGKALQAKPADGQLLASAATIETEAREFEKARDYLDQAIAAEPSIGDHLFLLADLEMREKQAPQAMEALARARSLGFRDSRMSINAWLLEAWGHVVLAEEAAKSSPPDVATAAQHLDKMRAALDQAAKNAPQRSASFRLQVNNVETRANVIRASLGTLWQD